MSRTRCVLAFVTFVAVLAAGAPVALAQQAPPPGGTSPTLLNTPAHGSPVWVFVLVAAATAIVTVAVMLFAMRRWNRLPRPVGVPA